MDPALSKLEAQYRSVLTTVQVLSPEEIASALLAGVHCVGNLSAFLPIVLGSMLGASSHIDKGMDTLNEIAGEILTDADYLREAAKYN